MTAQLATCTPMKMAQMLYDEMINALRAALPEEACGLIAGNDDGASRLYPVENSLHSPVAYEMAPLAQVEAMLALESEGHELVGIYHSHPTGPAVPSASDVAQSYYPDVEYVIVSFLVPHDPVARSFTIQEGEVREVEFVIV